MTSVPADCEAQWVSVDGDVIEAALWFNALARPGVRRAALVIGAARRRRTDQCRSASIRRHQDVQIGPVEGYLYEPDGAVIRAGLVADLALQLGGHLLDEHIAYICAPELQDTPFARAYKVLEVMPLQRQGAQGLGQGQPASASWTSRSAARRSPRRSCASNLLTGSGKGPNKATLVLTRIGEDRVAIVVEPIRSTGGRSRERAARP